jgi:uncharacterized protein (DUF3084 family)
MANNEMTITVGLTKDIVELCHALMQERDNLETHLDLSAQALDAVTRERDEARAWARRMKRERDALQQQLDEEKNRVTYSYRIGMEAMKAGKWRYWWIE